MSKVPNVGSFDDLLIESYVQLEISTISTQAPASIRTPPNFTFRTADGATHEVKKETKSWEVTEWDEKQKVHKETKTLTKMFLQDAPPPEEDNLYLPVYQAFRNELRKRITPLPAKKLTLQHDTLKRYERRGRGDAISAITLHISELLGPSVINTFLNPDHDQKLPNSAGGFDTICLGTHFFVLLDGTSYEFADVDLLMPVHAWPVYRYSVGIDLVHPPHPEEDPVYPNHRYPYPKEQIHATARLCRSLADEYFVRPDRITGHMQIQPGNHQDPGPGFQWAEFRMRMTECLFTEQPPRGFGAKKFEKIRVALEDGIPSDPTAHFAVAPDGVIEVFGFPDTQVSVLVVQPDNPITVRSFLELMVYLFLRGSVCPAVIEPTESAEVNSLIDDLRLAWRVIWYNDHNRSVTPSPERYSVPGASPAHEHCPHCAPPPPLPPPRPPPKKRTATLVPK